MAIETWVKSGTCLLLNMVGALGVHAILMNTWPDPYIATQEDTRERADATQMKRAAVIAGSTAYIMASAGPDDIPQLTQNVLNKSKIRLAMRTTIYGIILLFLLNTNSYSQIGVFMVGLEESSDTEYMKLNFVEYLQDSFV